MATQGPEAGEPALPAARAVDGDAAPAGPGTASPPWRPGARVARLRASQSYGVVLALVLASVAFAAAAPDSPWTSSVLLLLQTATFLAALWTSGLARVGWGLGIAAAVVPVTAAALQLVDGGRTLTGSIGLLSALLVAATAAAIARGVLDQRAVNIQSVRGAICIYLLLGMLFVFLYGAVAVYDSGAFFTQGTDGSRSIRVYFSYVTLATLGYGDYTPAGDLGRTLAIAEGLIGQLYLVTVVALVVSQLGRRGDAA